jgi:hypothetical protein
VKGRTIVTGRVETAGIARAELREILSYWHDKRGGGSLPRIDAMSSRDLGPYLRNVMLVEIEPGTERFRYHTVGEGVLDLYRRQIDGKYLDEMPDRYRRVAEPAYREVVEEPYPRYARFRFAETWWVATYERLMLPLAALDGDRVAQLLVGIYPRDAASPDISPGRAIGADCRLVWGAGARCARRHGRLSSAS